MYTDQEKNRIAWKEYSKFNVGREVDIEIDGKKEKTIALTKATVDQKSIKKRISSSLTELESSLDQVIGTIDSDLAGKFSNSVKEGVGRKKLELNDLQEFCKTK